MWCTANLFILFKVWCLSYVWITTSNNDDVHCSLCLWNICTFIGLYFPLHCFTIWKLNKCNLLGPQWESQSLYNIHPVSGNSQSGYKVIHHLSFVKLAENSFDLCPWDSRQEVTINDSSMLMDCSPNFMEGDRHPAKLLYVFFLEIMWNVVFNLMICLINMCLCVHVCVLSCFSHVWLLATLWTIAHQALCPRGFSRQESWSGLPCPPSGSLPEPGIKFVSIMFPSLAG